MTALKTLLCILLTAGLAAPATAEEPAAAESSRTPGDLRNEDRVAMVGYVNEYGRCLRERSMALLAGAEDVRVVVDQAMQECEKHMDALRQDLAERRVDPGFAEHFAEGMKKRTVRKLLPEVMAGQGRR